MNQIRSELHVSQHDGTVQIRHVQDNAQDIADALKEARADNLGRKLDWGYHALCIPELEYYKLCRKYPDLKSTDKAAREAAWSALLAGHEIDHWRVRK